MFGKVFERSLQNVLVSLVGLREVVNSISGFSTNVSITKVEQCFSRFPCGWLLLFCNCSFSYTFCHYSKLGGWSVGASGEREVAFSAFPNADAYPFHSLKPALWAWVGLSHFLNYFTVAFSNCGSVAGAESACWADLFHFFSHVFFTSLVFYGFVQPCL